MKSRGHAFALRGLPCALSCIGCMALALVPARALVACATAEDSEASDAGAAATIPSNDAEAGFPDGTADGDVPPIPCALGNLCKVPMALELGAITAIAGRTREDVWAAGSAGLVMHWDGSRWTSLETPIHETLATIALADGELWGAAGTLVLRRGLDPNSVRTVRTPGLALSGITVLSNGAAYVSIQPNIEGGWGTPPNPFATIDFTTGKLVFPPMPVHPLTGAPQSYARIRALHAVPNEAIWLVGDQAIVFRYPLLTSGPPNGDAGDGGDGGTGIVGQGVAVPISSNTNLRAAWGYQEHLWAAGEGGVVFHFDGSEWHVSKVGTVATIQAIFGFSPADIWAAGDNGTVLHFDGSDWSQIPLAGYQGSLRAIWGSGSSDIWIGGEGGMFHWGVLP